MLLSVSQILKNFARPERQVSSSQSYLLTKISNFEFSGETEEYRSKETDDHENDGEETESDQTDKEETGGIVTGGILSQEALENLQTQSIFT